MGVTPFAGVWIEIIRPIVVCLGTKSLPSRECGLKSAYDGDIRQSYKVTPFAGVWIEIIPGIECTGIARVTPFAGVWIEMLLPM